MESKVPAYVTTYSGGVLDVLNPDPEMIQLEDIAQGLSNMCRWNGQCNFFASVAEHSVAVYRITKCRSGLMHDASEGYIADIVKTVKPYLTNYYEIEDKLMVAIAKKFDFVYPFDKSVKSADLQQLSTEAFYLMKNHGDHFEWDLYSPNGRPAVANGIQPMGWSPKKAKKEFLKAYCETV